MKNETSREADKEDRSASETFWRSLALNTQRTIKLYSSASRLALGQSRWIAASAVLGTLSLALVGTGVAALVSPYDGIATASLTADRAPRVVAWSTGAPVETKTASIDGLRQTTEEDAGLAFAAVMTAAQAAAEEAPDTTDETRTASLADPGLFEPQTEESLKAEAAKLPAAPKEVATKVELASGETLMEVLEDAGVDRIDAYHAVAAMTSYYSPRKLRAGQEISLTFMEQPDALAEGESGTPAKYLTALSIEPDIERAIEVTRNEDGSFGSREIMHEFTEGFVRAAGTIDNSLFLDGERAGVPPQIIIEMIRMYSYSVDFQREIQPGDAFEVYFSRKFDEQQRPVKEGDVLFAALTVGGKQHKLWRFDPTGDGEWDYFDENGQSMKKFLMKTPIDGARLSSRFGLRKHPILGYSKMHAGVDFAAPRGTPVYAAGNGTVTRANRFGSFGNYVSIRHANGYETAYAHLNGFARGIRAGTRVRQGQVIAYVGTTGRSTGPHLHYEVHVNGKKMNPLALKVPTGRKLEGNELAAFKAMRSEMTTQMAAAPTTTKLAQASADSDGSAN
ncbi:peptidoglycan DD-metalloendopeptidase family protein [Parvibaculum sp.]|uniref:M23 family metallopeptidase n=1 Tax=Parvibaculum sp. TaxID=2024848 RepID=UPI001B2EC03E|nr:peptidoglycan DD-metalloendopeptidase family protein [Parvibaculum sp.]MBO6634191.1 peptidoglycan DD-metalloendopeptidase family protein [Parvibaculum sp.]MBO6676948.1 peptidoglycan DD-metalloendopeptidase family protein [Parvibaculum sp.]MBO6904081.1 peptidoglycan DD-metalloendopeptidase family protein [Parvibaculum sp.]